MCACDVPNDVFARVISNMACALCRGAPADASAAAVALNFDCTFRDLVNSAAVAAMTVDGTIGGTLGA